ncbi:unnamed protein product [Paramecium pentaurelia]|uniref:MORN repeat protein n=1 Tax=Paramecium pentaurelia TaxID=43138 RepID=A0A8S1SVS8_9CILI|nr:unnamed protein product [Paramecium pentaurelia]
MGSCNQCVQRQEPLQQVTIQNNIVTLLQHNHQMVIKIQTAYRAYICRQRFKQELAKKRSMNQKRSNSTDDCLIEHRTISYSPRVDPQEVRNLLPMIDNHIKRKSLSHFGREYSAKLLPKESDLLDDNQSDQIEQTPLQQSTSSPIKSLRSSLNQSKKMQSFRFKCVLTHEILEPRDKIKIQTINKRLKLDAIKLIGGNIYIGEWLDQMPDGKGKYTFSDQSFYYGEFSKGCLHGRGEFKSKEGNIYRGQWYNNRMQGQGSYIYNNGCKYEGFWERDLPNGEGMEWYSNGSVYVGNFLNGEKHGFGKITFITGEIYEGEFEFDDFNGKGIYRWQDGRVYDGNWVDGKMNGKGTLTWPDGRYYQGEYINDQKNGFGIFQFADGRKYVGLWKQGLQHGQGEFFKGQGQDPTRGIWKQGKLVKLL